MIKKISSVLAGAAVFAGVAFAVPAFAQEAPTGQIEGGNIYRVATLPNGEFTDPTTATCGDTVQFRVRIHNIGAFAAENVKVQATLPTATATSHSSMVTVSSSNSNTVTDTAGVNLNQAGKLTYVAGSTELLDANQAKLGNLADGIVGGGVTLADPVGVSTQQKRSVQFKAQVTCDVPGDIQVCELATKKVITIKENQFDASKHSKNLADCAELPKDILVCELSTKKIITIKENQYDAAKHTKDLAKCAPAPGKINVCELATKKVITIDENAFDASKHSKDLSKCVATPVTPEVLPNTGAGEIAGLFAAVTVAGAIAYRIRLAVASRLS